MTGSSYVVDQRLELAALRKRCLEAEAELAAQAEMIAMLRDERERWADVTLALMQHRSALAIAVCDYLDGEPGVGAAHLRGVELLARQVTMRNGQVTEYLVAACSAARRE